MTTDCEMCDKKNDCNVAKELGCKICDLINSFWKERDLCLHNEANATVYVLARLVVTTTKVAESNGVDKNDLLNNMNKGLRDGIDAAREIVKEQNGEIN